MKTNNFLVRLKCVVSFVFIWRLTFLYSGVLPVNRFVVILCCFTGGAGHCLESIKVKTCKRWQAAHLHRRETFETFYILLHWGDLFQGILQFEIWTMISLLYSGPKYGSVPFMFSKGKLCKCSRTCKMFNRQFIQFARIPVEFVARLWDMSTQKYNNFSIAAVMWE